ncbi:uncharacterized protein LOC123564003 [Mercenaria mercenaria]|uniref:uncharacterized protein LOC123564003 n=1 Tax=Mercenaria mercenaria TaxID=6596 RepID=UPI001E1DD6B2|nr:uncharacterized protein LOC123564003 [Mercenaria mercenaria]
MSVSDPLLKKLKAFVLALRSKAEPVTDSHTLLCPLCENIESILLKGLKANISWLGSSKTEYWTWISKIPALLEQNRVNPLLSMSITAVKKCEKTKRDRGRGRNFVRIALMKKLLVSVITFMKDNTEFAQLHYDGFDSIIGNEILTEIFLSLLHELQQVTFSLQLKNASFLDICWDLPVNKQYEFVPSDDLGLDIRTVKGYPLVTQVDPNSVAGEDGKVCVGDVLDEMCGASLRGVGKSGVYYIFHQHEGQPVQLSVIKAQNKDGSLYGPIGQLRGIVGINDGEKSPSTPDTSSPLADFEDRLPPEAILPEEIVDEVPVHDSEGRASYKTIYLGKSYLGKDGRVNMIEQGVAEMINRSMEKQNVILELGEKELYITEVTSNKVLVQHLYTEISACGRRTDALKNFAFIAGETYCSLAKEFYCHVFEAVSPEEAKVILCTIAQGFDRTHLMT